MTNKQAIGWLSLVTPFKAVTYEEFSDFNEAVDKAIKALSEPKTGHWIVHENAEEAEGHLIVNYECSECHNWSRNCSDFCPDCGSHNRMKEVEHDI